MKFHMWLGSRYYTEDEVASMDIKQWMNGAPPHPSATGVSSGLTLRGIHTLSERAGPGEPGNCLKSVSPFR